MYRIYGIFKPNSIYMTKFSPRILQSCLISCQAAAIASTSTTHIYLPSSTTAVIPPILSGNRREFDIKLEIQEIISELIQTLETQIKFKKSVTGIHALLHTVLLYNISNPEICEKQIRKIYRLMLEIIDPTDFLAYLVVSLISIDNFKGAKRVAKSFSIPGRSFIDPLNFLAQNKDLLLIEKFAKLIEDVYFRMVNPKSFYKSDILQKHRYKNAPDKRKSISASKSSVDFMISIWKPKQPEKKNTEVENSDKDKKDEVDLPKVKRHEVDIKQLFLLTNELIDIWSTEAEECLDCDSIVTLCKFIEINQIQLTWPIEVRCRRVFAEAGREPPALLLSAQPDSDDIQKS